MTFESDMTFSMIKTLLTVFMTLLLVFALTDFKYSRKKILAVYGVYLIYVGAAAWLCYTMFGWTNFMRSCVVTIFVPAFFLTYCVATDHARQAVFNYATQFDIALILSFTGTLLNTALHGTKFSDLVIRVLLFTAVFLLGYRFMRKPFRQMADNLQKNWGILAAVPVSFSILFLACGLFPVHFTKSPWAVIQVYLAAIVMVTAYGVVFRSLKESYAALETKRQNDILAAQAAALDKHADTLIRQNEQEAVYHNNLRYYTQILYAMLQNGDTNQAIEYLGNLDTEYARSKPKHYCNHAPLNDVISFYLGRAEERGITVTTNLYFPPVLPADWTELAAVFANAIENAIEAMQSLPAGREKRLEFISTDQPQFAFEIANTDPEGIQFDADGLPLGPDGQPGIRTRSILAFARSHKGMLDCKISDGMFRLRLLISNR